MPLQPLHGSYYCCPPKGCHNLLTRDTLNHGTINPSSSLLQMKYLIWILMIQREREREGLAFDTWVITTHGESPLALAMYLLVPRDKVPLLPWLGRAAIEVPLAFLMAGVYFSPLLDSVRECDALSIQHRNIWWSSRAPIRLFLTPYTQNHNLLSLFIAPVMICSLWMWQTIVYVWDLPVVGCIFFFLFAWGVTK